MINNITLENFSPDYTNTTAKSAVSYFPPSTSSTEIKPDIVLIGTVVSSICKVTKQELFSKQRGTAPVALARQIAMYMMHITCGLSYTEVGRAFGRDRTTVSHACQLIEDKREDPNMDWSLDLMEHSIFSLNSKFNEVS